VSALVVAFRLGFVLTGLVVGDDTEIMVGELQIIFGLHAVAIMLGVLGKLLVLVEQLRGIAASAAVDPVARIGAALIAIIPASATAVIIAIVVQG
tara:strand:+ start:230 stop:514 length:285 start_codon:yes stop_codon:yes gene_type:complete